MVEEHFYFTFDLKRDSTEPKVIRLPTVLQRGATAYVILSSEW